jgi:hypothetical protein
MVYMALWDREKFPSQAIPLIMRDLGQDESNYGIRLQLLEKIGRETLPYLKSYYEILKKRVKTTEIRFLTLNSEGYSDEERYTIRKLNKIEETIKRIHAQSTEKKPSSKNMTDLSVKGE